MSTDDAITASTPTEAELLDLGNVLDHTRQQLLSLDQYCRAERNVQPEIIRRLYRLRAYIEEARDAEGRRATRQIQQDVADEEEMLRRAVDEYKFTTVANETDIHITEPFRDEVEHDRTLCRKPSATLFDTRPEGELCPTCCTAVTARIFARRPDLQSHHSTIDQQTCDTQDTPGTLQR